MTWIVIIAIWITLAITAGIIAAGKNRCSGCWFLVVLLFAPAIIPLLALPPKERGKNRNLSPR